METKYVRVIGRGFGDYDIRCDGTIVALRGERAWLLEDIWCGNNLEGQTYRQHVKGHRRKWPKGADKAIDATEQAAARVETYFAHPELCSVHELPFEELERIARAAVSTPVAVARPAEQDAR